VVKSSHANQVLSEQLASQIAAGEVVERPSSVVKELVENSIDAGATVINVDIREAGRKRIQVADNGRGIPAAEIETAFRRHATSKLDSVEGLNSIATLGFRGEALAAIAAVCQLTVVSRPPDAEAGVRLSMDGGILSSRELVGAPQGTVISVENLFYNTPARLKFLKSDTTERKLIDEFVSRYALAYPGIRFRLTHNGRVTFQSSGNDSLLDVLIAIYGPEIARSLQEIRTAEVAEAQIEVRGFIGPPSVHWANRGHVALFVNGRWIKDTRLTYAVIQAYQSLLPTGRYPLAILFLTLPPDLVDVNVHPAKTEVRFRQGKVPFGVVQRAVRETLLAEAPVRRMQTWSAGEEPVTPGWEGFLNRDAFGSAAPDQQSMGLVWPEETPGEAVSAREKLPIMRVVGQIGAAYIITEGPDGLFLIDQHAAHRRILYEKLFLEWEKEGVVRKQLSVGAAVTLSPAQSTALEDRAQMLHGLGIVAEPFGPQTFMLREIPVLAADHDPAQLLVALMRTWEEKQKLPDDAIAALMLQTMSKTLAIRPGQTLTHEAMSEIVHGLEGCDDPFVDPEGLPTFIYLSVAQLAREFGRF
jgi:DNA mismatch repair protein MutL